MAVEAQFDPASANPLFELPVYIGDSGPHALTVDTGASITVLTRSFADDLGIAAIDSRTAMDGSGEVRRIEIASLPTITIGDTSIRDVRVALLDALPGCVGPGVVGADLFMRFVTVIDYGQGRFALMTPEEFDRDPAGVRGWHPIELIGAANNVALVEVRIAGTGGFHFILDTGASETLVSSDLVERLELTRESSEEIITAFGGEQGVRCTLPSLDVGGLCRRSELQVIESRAAWPRAALERPFDGILAARFFSGHPLVIDYARRRLGVLS